MPRRGDRIRRDSSPDWAVLGQAGRLQGAAAKRAERAVRARSWSASWAARVTACGRTQDTMSSYFTSSSSSSCQEPLVKFARTNAMDDTSMRSRGSTPRPRTEDGHAELVDQVLAPLLVALRGLPVLADRVSRRLLVGHGRRHRQSLQPRPLGRQRGLRWAKSGSSVSRCTDPDACLDRHAPGACIATTARSCRSCPEMTGRMIL
jgi:hypothetical protein